MATHSSVLAWKIPWTEEPRVHQVTKSHTRLSDQYLLFLKPLLNLLQYCFCFRLWIFFVPEACGILVTQPGMEPGPPALEGQS